MAVNFSGFKNAGTSYYHSGNNILAREIFTQVTGNDKLVFAPLLDKENQDFVKIIVSGKQVPLEDSVLIINDRAQKINELKPTDIPFVKMVNKFLGKISEQTTGFKFDLPPKKALETLGIVDNFDDTFLRDAPINRAFDGNAVINTSKEMKSNLEQKLAEFLSSS